jgi:hypothetical protein
MIEGLASYRRCRERMTANWPAFLGGRRERLSERERYGTAAERVTENILEDLLTGVLDWSLSDIDPQTAETAPVYRQRAEVLEQLGRLGEIAAW